MRCVCRASRPINIRPQFFVAEPNPKQATQAQCGASYCGTSSLHLPDKCLERIHIRNRMEESTITLDYLDNCHTYHTNWLKDSITNIITIDGHNTIEQIRNETNMVINKLIA